MNWIDGISNAVEYIEDNLDDEISMEEVAKRACVSSFYFQKAFSLLCDMTVSEYIRRRRLACAATELMTTDSKVIDVAMKYGYDSPDSFTKAFIRFHGVSPSAVRKDGAMIKTFAPLKIKLTLEGGFVMDYRIVEKEAFTVIGNSKMFGYANAYEEVPKFWKEHYEQGKGTTVCGMFGINIDKDRSGKQFEYIIADIYFPWKDIPDGFKTFVIPKNTWVVFPCKGALPEAIQSVNTKIFSEWLPNSKEYEISDGYYIEMYSDPNDCPKGNLDENYYTEIWIPVSKK